MKLLVISARYPPYHFGGYELRCKNIMDALASRGYSICVLTSQREAAKDLQVEGTSPNEYPVYRRLHLGRLGGWIDRLTLRRWTYLLGMALVFARDLWIDWVDTAFVDQQIRQFRPDVIYLGHVTAFSRALLPYLSGINISVVYDEGGSGLIDLWTEKGIWHKLTDEYIQPNRSGTGFLRPFIAAICRLSGNRLKDHSRWPARMKVVFNSRLNYQNALNKGVPLDGAQIVHAGIDAQKFTFLRKHRLASPVHILVPGRIEPRKGQLDAVSLLGKLLENGIDANLTLVGEKWVDAYHEQIVASIKASNLEGRVQILPMVGHEQLAGMYQGADFCFFSSYFQTGFSRVPLEAMACGCVIISYGNEGSNEVIRDGENGFLVAEADYPAIVNRVRQLIASPEYLQAVCAAARNDVDERFSLHAYVGKLEELIQAA